MATSATSLTSRRHRRRWLIDSDLFPVALSAVIATALAFAVLRDPATVESVAVTNDSDYDIRVQIRGADGGWMPLSQATRRETTATSEVIDQGETWTFRFASQGRAGGQIEIDRAVLEASDWTLEIPDDTIQQLRDAGAPLPP
jgi:hypothetical protein